MDFYESIDGFTHLLRGRKTNPFECTSRQNAEPNLNLIQPGRMSRSIVKMHIFVSGKPAVCLWLMSAEVIQDDMDFLIGVRGNDFIHKDEKLTTSAAVEMPCLS